MIDFTSLPSSVAKPLDELLLTERYNHFSFTGFLDEEALFTDINKKLDKLEMSNEMNKIELESIISLSELFQVALEEKEEVLTRIDWLQRLYKAKNEMKSVNTKQKAKQIRNLIASVQTCPMKKELIAEINSLESFLPAEETTCEEPTRFSLLMEKAIDKADNIFVNLGRAGREYVIEEVLKRHGHNAVIADVHESAIQLEHRVQALTEITDCFELITKLEQLPLPDFAVLEADKKEKIAKSLIQEHELIGLFALDRRIAQLSDVITRKERENYERENVITLSDGKAAVMIDARNILFDKDHA